MPQSDVTSEASAPTLRFSVALEASHLLRARERLRDYLHLHCADAELVDDVVLCLEEACTNVIRHSGADEAMRVRLRFAGDQLICQVADRGKGFDIASFDPQAVPDPLASGGRGLHIIAQIMDEMSLRHDGGLEVRMVKKAVARRALPGIEIAPGDLQSSRSLTHRDLRQRALLEEIDEAFFALDWEYRYAHANAAMLRLTDIAREELLGRTPFEVWPQLAGTEVEQRYREAMELGRPSVFEQLSLVTGDWLEVRVYPTATGISVYLREINERKRRELERDELLEALGASQTVLTRSQKLAHVGGWELDLTSDRLTWSDEVYRIFGLEPQEFGATYEAFLEHVHPDDREAVDAAYSGSLRENRDSYEIEHRVVRKDNGEVRQVLERCDHIRDASGTIVRSVGMVLDMSERRRAEAAKARQGQVLGGINTILEAALAAASEEKLGEVCLKVAEELTGSAFGFIGEIDGDGLLHDIALSDPGWQTYAIQDESGHRRPPGNFELNGLYGHVLLTGEALIANAPAEHPRSIGLPEGHPPLTAFLGVPLKDGERTVGIIAVANREGGYGAEQQVLLEAIAPSIREALDRRRAEEALRGAEARASDLVRHAPVCIYEIDFRGPSFRSVNDAMCALTGYGRDELLAMDPFDLLDAEGQKLFSERISKGLPAHLSPSTSPTARRPRTAAVSR